MINLKKYKFTDEDEEWSFQEHLESIVDFKQSNYKIKGLLNFFIEMEDNDNSSFEKPQIFQQNALDYFINNQEIVLEKLSVSIMNYLHKDNLNKSNENVPNSLDFVKKNVSIESLNILGTEKNNYSYAVFIFGYEDEHGLGVITHKDRIIDIGDADTALFDWNDKILEDRLTAEEWKKHREYIEEIERKNAEYLANYYKEREEILEKEAKERDRKMNIKWWQFWKK